MRIAGQTVRMRARHAETGTDREILLAELVMDDPADAGRAGGWYWRFRNEGGEPDDLEAWQDAVRAERGPHRSPTNAVAAVGHWTQAAAEIAARLGEAAELVRTGDLAPESGAVSEWLRTAERMDRAARGDHRPAGPESRSGDTVARSREAADGNLGPGDPAT